MRQSALDANRIALIGAPSSAGARLVGQEQAPQRLRDAGLVQLLRSDGHEVADLGDLAQVSFAPDPQHPKQQNISLVVNVLEQVASRVEAALADGAWPLVIGGDCTVTIGVLAALTKHFPELGMIYLDGDVDLNTPDTTHTGILDGMVLAHILVHFDVDVVDVADFPAADVPHDPGLGLMQVREALGIFLASDKSVGLVVTEFNASRDNGGTLALQLIDLIREAKGYGDK